ncbi:DUF2784 domain-containing protein [Fulvivirga lutea]|uniref:DUF2784 domain-containing protein n=1 Tax=Fulvivirga lutea TaxID=2810512 RepID=A0A974WDP4_9BACT|nr:DUF2784 domain-containing protein [Fulvivirga lutea]QSE95956.1 DUF2784 domain-containing protein [Fulvivirga lutea]
MLKSLDVLLFITHCVVILFNLFGWVHPKTRKLHLVVVGLTLFSWLVLGFWKGFGYCILTDWEWDIKRELGERNLPASFIQYLSNNIFGLGWSRIFVDGVTLGSFLLAIVITLKVNFFKGKKV